MLESVNVTRRFLNIYSQNGNPPARIDREISQLIVMGPPPSLYITGSLDESGSQIPVGSLFEAPAPNGTNSRPFDVSYFNRPSSMIIACRSCRVDNESNVSIQLYPSPANG
ncbi:hypothetical protein FGO68_gene7742 [Halteria grandinella]|uniref:Uncharacterized protein n=1 Tax=Halteria grandinella TaxID=5974 RepID=A0A8J8SUJ6_HALGN|nr:hypothetical protein FGO68_gene7742 [Halteria grandinella]